MQGVPNKINPQNPTPRYVIIKMAKLKIENFKGNKRKTESHTKEPYKALSDFSAETLQASRKQHDIFKVLKGKTKT